MAKLRTHPHGETFVKNGLLILFANVILDIADCAEPPFQAAPRISCPERDLI